MAAFASGLTPLGYCAFFCWPEIEAARAASSPERLMDLIRVAARRSRLPEDDPRRIPIDEAWARAAHPRLFVRSQHGQQESGHRELLREMGNFIAGHPWRETYARRSTWPRTTPTRRIG